jgi:hypothetical protein
MQVLHKLFLTSLLFILFHSVWCQQLPKQDRLLQLKQSRTVTHKYVNFDVLKVMAGSGKSNDNLAQNEHAFSWSVQILCPFALFRENKIHIAYGLSVGRSAMAWRNTRLLFSEDKLLDLLEDKEVDRGVQKTGFIGVVVLPFIQVGSFKQYTIMAGPSINFNILRNRMFYHTTEGVNSIKTVQQIKKLSIPLLLEISRIVNRSKTLSLGVFGSYDIMERFKSSTTNNINQVVGGGSIAIIL